LIARVGDFAYLDKFAILEDARGEGLARTVWAQVTADHPILYWRSRTENGFNAFYAEEADGSVKRGPWTIFWKGEPDFSRIPERVEAIAGLPTSFAGDHDE
jgi:acetylglutamate kinase